MPLDALCLSGLVHELSQAASGALTFGPGADPAAVTAAIRQAAAAAPVWLQDLLISLALGV